MPAEYIDLWWDQDDPPEYVRGHVSPQEDEKGRGMFAVTEARRKPPVEQQKAGDADPS